MRHMVIGISMIEIFMGGRAVVSMVKAVIKMRFMHLTVIINLSIFLIMIISVESRMVVFDGFTSVWHGTGRITVVVRVRLKVRMMRVSICVTIWLTHIKVSIHILTFTLLTLKCIVVCIVEATYQITVALAMVMGRKLRVFFEKQLLLLLLQSMPFLLNLLFLFFFLCQRFIKL